VLHARYRRVLAKYLSVEEEDHLKFHRIFAIFGFPRHGQEPPGAKFLALEANLAKGRIF
jgi:hypothetical protein